MDKPPFRKAELWISIKIPCDKHVSFLNRAPEAGNPLSSVTIRWKRKQQCDYRAEIGVMWPKAQEQPPEVGRSRERILPQRPWKVAQHDFPFVKG